MKDLGDLHTYLGLNIDRTPESLTFHVGPYMHRACGSTENAVEAWGLHIYPYLPALNNKVSWIFCYTVIFMLFFFLST